MNENIDKVKDLLVKLLDVSVREYTIYIPLTS